MSEERPTRMVQCAVEGCENEHADHYWGNIKAQDEGWFASRAESKAYCPEHVPDWVPEWRARQQAKKDKEGAIKTIAEALDLDPQFVRRIRITPDFDIELTLDGGAVPRNALLEASGRLNGTWTEKESTP